MKTKTNRRVKRSKKTRRTRRNLRKVRGGGLIAKGREWLARRNRRKQEMDKIDNEYWSCKLRCEMTRDDKLILLNEQFDNELKKARAAQQQSQTRTATKVDQESIKAQVPTIDPKKDEYDKSGAAIQVAEYKENNRNAYSRMESWDFQYFEKHDSHRKGNPTDNGWYVDLSDQEKPFLRNTKDRNFNLTTYGIQNEYEAHLTKLPNPSFKYKSSIPSSPDYILVQKGTGELEWKNVDNGTSIQFNPGTPLLITNENDYEVVLQPPVEPAQ